MKKYKYVILGAGPSGLSFANRLRANGEQNFIILEKEQNAGGLCRSVEMDGAALDIGGGHFLDVRREEVLAFLFQFLPQSEWREYDRDSRILLGSKLVNHPLEANIWQLDIDEQVRYLSSIAKAGCNQNESKPVKFHEWIKWKLGEVIAEQYMIPYNTKMFGDGLETIGTYWLEKLPNVSFEETLRSCLERKPYGKQPAHQKFLYPIKYGYGEVWNRMAYALGDNLRVNYEITKIDFENRIVNDEYQGEKIINTIPLCGVKNLCGIPDILVEKIHKLVYTTVVIDYYQQDYGSEAQWIYIPDLQKDYHRILVRKNFIQNSKGFWTECNQERENEEKESYFTYVNKYAYPVNTIDKPGNMNEILSWLNSKNVFGLGRWGEWEHYNSDVVVEKALYLADRLSISSS